MSLLQLKDLCRQRHHPVTGTKPTLIARLTGLPEPEKHVDYHGPDPEEGMEEFFGIYADYKNYGFVEPPMVPGMEIPDRPICSESDDEITGVMEKIEEAFSQANDSTPFCVNTVWNIPKPSIRLLLPDGSSSSTKDVTFPLSPEGEVALSAVCTPAPFGRGEETMLDTNVRNTLQLDPSKFTVIGNSFHQMMSKENLDYIRKVLTPSSEEMTATLYKLLYYPPGSFFKSHVDTLRSQDMFATLVIELQAPSSGGMLSVTHQGKVVECTHRYTKGRNKGVGVTAFFADCKHEVQRVECGARVALVYVLTRRGTLPQPTPFNAVADSVKSAFRTFNKLGDPCRFLGYLLAHQYAVTSVMPDSLKGADRIVYDQLQHSNEFEMFVAPVSIFETGEAGSDDPYDPPLAQELREEVEWEGDEGDGAIGFRETYLVDPRKAPKKERGAQQYVWLYKDKLESLVPLRWINPDPKGRGKLVSQDVTPSGNEGTGFALSYIHFALFIHEKEKDMPVPAAAEGGASKRKSGTAAAYSEKSTRKR